eukprot:scaffold53655_cov36-Phaeocystis_antarctica.AAC.2
MAWEAVGVAVRGATGAAAGPAAGAAAARAFAAARARAADRSRTDGWTDGWTDEMSWTLPAMPRGSTPVGSERGAYHGLLEPIAACCIHVAPRWSVCVC